MCLGGADTGQSVPNIGEGDVARRTPIGTFAVESETENVSPSHRLLSAPAPGDSPRGKRRPLSHLDARRSPNPEREPGTHDRCFLAAPALVRSRLAQVLLAGLSLTLLVSGCGDGTSPETRARRTMTALEGTRTPSSLEAARTAIARGTFTGIDRESRVTLTAEASLRIRTTRPQNVATHVAGTSRTDTNPRRPTGRSPYPTPDR